MLESSAVNDIYVGGVSNGCVTRASSRGQPTRCGPAIWGLGRKTGILQNVKHGL
jgi:hypothetical protein